MTDTNNGYVPAQTANPYDSTDSSATLAVAAPENDVQAAPLQESDAHKPYTPSAEGKAVASAAPFTPPVKESRWSFTAVQKGFAFMALLLGYLFNRTLFIGAAPGAGALVFFEIALVSSLIFLIKDGSKLKVGSYLWLVVLMAFPVSFILIDNPVLKGFGALFMVVAAMFWIYSSAAGVGGFRQTFFADFFSATFASPFRNFLAMPVAIFKPAKDVKSRVLRYVLLGLLITIPFTALIAGLLLSSDETFRNLIGFENIGDKIGEFAWRFILAIPIGMIIFSVLLSAVRGKEAVKERKSRYKGGKLNNIIFVTAFVPVILLYLTFFVSQFAYFTGAFQSILPANYTYAEYARQGFFELCAVVAINIVMILLTVLLCKKKENGHFSVGVKLVVSVICLCSMMLVAISVAKMAMYTSVYGLTHKRIYTLWFTLVLLMIVLAALIKIFAPKFKFFNAAVGATVILFALLCFVNVDAIIAKHNVQWYQQGKISWMGEEALYELDHSAVKYLDALYTDNTEVVNEIDPGYRSYYRTWYNDPDWHTEEEFENYDDYKETVAQQVRGFYRYLASYDNGVMGFNLCEHEANQIFDRRGTWAFRDKLYEDEEVFVYT